MFRKPVYDVTTQQFHEMISRKPIVLKFSPYLYVACSYIVWKNWHDTRPLTNVDTDLPESGNYFNYLKDFSDSSREEKTMTVQIQISSYYFIPLTLEKIDLITETVNHTKTPRLLLNPLLCDGSNGWTIKLKIILPCTIRSQNTTIYLIWQLFCDIIL